MPRVAVDELKPGWYLAGNVYNHSGLVLLTAGMRLRETYIRRLQELGIRAVDVQPRPFRNIKPRDILGTELRGQSAAAVAQVLTSASRGNADPRPVVPFVGQIVDRVLENSDVLLGLTDIRAHDAYTHAHSVNVCLIAALIGKALQLSRTELAELATGAVLHDLGKVFIDRQILNKRGALTSDEYAIVKRHPLDGYAALHSHPLISERASLVVKQHHERLDGAGYPGGLRGDGIGPFARITAVADVYDAVSSDRPYRAALAPVDCLRLLGDDQEQRLWKRAVQALATFVAPFPEACTVRLNSGELAVVNQCYGAAPDRPQVNIFTDAAGKVLRLPRMVELLCRPDLSVTGIVSMERMAQLIRMEDYEALVEQAVADQS